MSGSRRFKVEIGMFVEGPATLHGISDARWSIDDDTMNEVLDALGANRNGAKAEFDYLSVEPADEEEQE